MSIILYKMALARYDVLRSAFIGAKQFTQAASGGAKGAFCVSGLRWNAVTP